MNTMLKLIAAVCIVTSLAMSGCVDSVTVDQNGTVTIDPANSASANVDVHTVSNNPEIPVTTEDDTKADELENSTDSEPVAEEQPAGEEEVEEVEEVEENSTDPELAGEDREQEMENSTDLKDAEEDAKAPAEDAEEIEDVEKEDTANDSTEEHANNTNETLEDYTEENNTEENLTDAENVTVENATVNNETIAEVTEDVENNILE